MIRKRTMIGILLIAVLLGAVPALTMAGPDLSRSAQGGTNLLQNPGFEGVTCAAGSPEGFCDGNWGRDTHDGSVHDNIFTPQKWVSWWRKGGDYGQPEIKTIPKVDPFIGPPARINSGNYAALLFTFYRHQDAGFYQVVTGLEPGSSVQFSAYGHGWSCDEDGTAYSCGDPWTLAFQVGIEPNGVADPFSPSIVWSEPRPSADAYSLIGPVTAQVGAGGSVAVFLRSNSKWPVKHLDAYWDDASLVSTSPGTPPTSTPPPPPPTATPGPSPTPRPKPTPRPDGAVVHVVESGDTLFGIALQYGITLDELRALNAGSVEGDIITPGQELVVSAPSQAPTQTPLPAPPTAEPTPMEEGPPTEEAVGGAGSASVCVLAYHDRDANTVRDAENEELLPNAKFTLANASGVLQEYTSDGISEPYCFTGLASGAYRVSQDAPPGYASSGPAEWPAALSEDTTLELPFGNVRGESSEGGEGTTPTEPGEEGSSDTPPSESSSRIRAILSTAA
jgi:LysM repeat protein